MNIAVLLISLVGLTAGAELLVRGSVSLAARLGVSSFFIGLTIVGFGTSTPELFTSVSAAIRGSADIAVGNVIGSNIFNIAVILGVAAVISPIPVKLEVVRSEVLVVILVACLPWVALATDGEIGRGVGLVFLLGLVAYLVRGYRIGRKASEDTDDPGREPPLPAADVVGVDPTPRSMAVDGLLVASGIAILALSSHFFVSAAGDIARGWGVSELVIGLTVVAAGTSAPELVTSVVAALRRQSDVAIGNVLGSNVFNLAGILGITAVISPQRVSDQVLSFDTPVMVLASLALIPIAASKARIGRAEGVLLIAGYLAYATTLFLWAPGWFD